jgi:hypothetical protein
LGVYLAGYLASSIAEADGRLPLAGTLVFAIGAAASRVRSNWRDRRRKPGVTRVAGELTALAAKLAGKRRTGGLVEWSAVLAGGSKADGPLTPRTQLRYAGGFVYAALQMRLRDLQRWSGRRLDWLLTTDERVITSIAAVFGVATVDLFLDGGLTKVVENAQNLGIIVGGLYGAAFVLRRVRGVEVVRRKREGDGGPDSAGN